MKNTWIIMTNKFPYEHSLATYLGNAVDFYIYLSTTLYIRMRWRNKEVELVKSLFKIKPSFK